MAHITEIKIHGLLGRTKPIHCKLERDVNVFFGANGSGKTTLLKVLDAAMNMNGLAVEKLPISRAEVHIYSISEQRTIKFVWDREVAAKDMHDFDEFANLPQLSASDRLRYLKLQKRQHHWKRTPPEPSDSAVRMWSHEFLPTTRLYVSQVATPEQSASKFKFSDEQLDAVFAETVNKAWLVFNSKVSEEVRAIQGEGLRAVLDFVLTSESDSSEEAELDPKAAYKSVKNFLLRQPSAKALNMGTLSTFQRRYALDKNLRRVVGNLDRVERRIEKSVAPVERFRETLNRLFSNGKRVSPQSAALTITLDSGLVLSPAALSSGEKHLLKLLLTAMTAEGNTVIIDEPELSMHIDWQRAFVSTVHTLNPDCQLIMATHSPEIMAELADSKIVKI